MAIPPILAELIERFESNKESYTSLRYNEAQVRREFIDPLFRLLGWDVDNTNGYPPRQNPKNRPYTQPAEVFEIPVPRAT
jgi:predicted type IV restriction endonuclease